MATLKLLDAGSFKRTPHMDSSFEAARKPSDRDSSPGERSHGFSKG